MSTLRQFDNSHRLTIVGSTGTGKSTAGFYHLSRANFHEIPWTIIDSKREPEIAAMEAQPIGLGESPPDIPGLYVIRIRPGSKDDASALEAYLNGVHERGNHGVFVDEGYSVYPVRSRGAMTNILTQGRSLRIPVIFNTQRPSGVGVEALSEATFFQIFDLYRPDDRKTAQEYVPLSDIDFREEKIGQYRSLWRDPAMDVTARLNPVRPAPESVDVINRRLDALYRQRDELRQLDAYPLDVVKVRLRSI